MLAVPRSLPRLTARPVGLLVGRLLGRLVVLGAALLLGLALLAVGGPATASTTTQPGACDNAQVAESTKTARAVFTGEVTAVVRDDGTDGQRGASFTQDVEVDRVYKGNISSRTVQVRTERGPQVCGLGQLVVGGNYVFFTQADGDLWAATGDGGTSLSSDQLVAQIERLLGDGRSPTPPQAEEAEFTPLDPGEPTTVTRAAAPGLALILVGLLGLVVVRRLGRR